ncbi:MAG TPA: hypothetical protein VMZ03_03910 [Chitinophagaceae bacterium]|nr:hypothetical protein [Chitinophagaceae bacterium]
MIRILIILLLFSCSLNGQVINRIKSFENIGTTGIAQYSGTTAQRPTGDFRWLRWNTDSSRIEIKTGPSTWKGLLFNGEASGGGSSSLTSAHLFVGNGSNVATDVAASGDLTLANTGAFTLNTVTVPKGGTGLATLTAYGLLAAGTTSTGNLQQIGIGTSGQVLTSNGAGALPTFQTAGGGADANAWHKAGDAFGAISILGTTDNFSFDIYSNNLARGRVYNTGKFGWQDTVELGVTGKTPRLRFNKSADGTLGHQFSLSTNDFISNNISGAQAFQTNGANKLYINSSGNVVVNGTASGGYDLFCNGLFNVTDNFLVLGQTLQLSGNPLTLRLIGSSRRVDMSINSSGLLAFAPVTSNDVNYQWRDSTQASGIIMDISARNKTIKQQFLQAPISTYSIMVHGLTDSITYQVPASTFATTTTIADSTGFFTTTGTTTNNTPATLSVIAMPSGQVMSVWAECVAIEGSGDYGFWAIKTTVLTKESGGGLNSGGTVDIAPDQYTGSGGSPLTTATFTITNSGATGAAIVVTGQTGKTIKWKVRYKIVLVNM